MHQGSCCRFTIQFTTAMFPFSYYYATPSAYLHALTDRIKVIACNGVHFCHCSYFSHTPQSKYCWAKHWRQADYEDLIRNLIMDIFVVFTFAAPILSHFPLSTFIHNSKLILTVLLNWATVPLTLIHRSVYKCYYYLHWW